MADMPDPRDPEEQLVANAFSAYRASAPKNFPAPDAADVMAKAEKARPPKRALTVSLAALAFTGLIAGGAAVAQTVASQGNDSANRDGSNTTVSSDDGSDTTTSESDDESSQSTQSDQPGNLDGLQITLPAWPNAAGTCGGGTYTFDEAGVSDPKSQWSLTDDGTATALDGDGAVNDLIVQIDCDRVSGIIALEHGDEGAVAAKGFVDAAEQPDVSVEVISVDGSAVTVDSGVTKDDGGREKTFVYNGDGFSEEPDGHSPSDQPSSPSDTPSDDDPTTTTPGSDMPTDLSARRRNLGHSRTQPRVAPKFRPRANCCRGLTSTRQRFG